MKTYDPIQRFDMGGTALGEMKETTHGDWVKLEDVLTLIARYQFLRDKAFVESPDCRKAFGIFADLHGEEFDTLVDDLRAGKRCPSCGCDDIEHRHASVPNCVGVETDWSQCADCDHQWGHQ